MTRNINADKPSKLRALKLSHFPSHGAISLEAKSRATAPQNKICQLVVSDRTGRPIDDDTLRQHFALELERAARSEHGVH